jgi:hypothetical protein
LFLLLSLIVRFFASTLNADFNWQCKFNLYILILLILLIFAIKRRNVYNLKI